MSSHHIVREKQEPALLLLGLNHFPDELLGQLLEWSPTVFAAHEIAEKIMSAGIKIDWVVGNDKREYLQNNVGFLKAGNSQSADAPLAYLIEHGYPSVNIVTDLPDLKAYTFYIDRINIVIFCNGKKIYPVNPGFSKWKPAGEVIELLSEVSDIHTKGLYKIGPNLFKTKHDGFFSLNFEGSFLLIAEYFQ